ncbi:MAG: serine/threonine-protein kinase [Kofleriaceae bacterium]
MTQIGAGGMASVYLAEHELLGHQVAIKVLDPTLATHSAIVTRFYNEAIALAKLKHPNLVGVHHVDRVPETGAVYMVLDYLEGESLADHLAARGPLTVTEVVRLLAGPVAALVQAHKLGAVHRDIKPDNLFLTHGLVKLLDFGLAQLAETIAASPGTKVGTVIGTPAYMATEQLAGKRVTGAADMYAVAVTVYEALTQRFPDQRRDESRAAYVAVAAGELLYRHEGSAAIDIRERITGMSDGVAREIMRALSRDPAKRHASVGEFLYALALADSEESLAVLQEVASELMPRSQAQTVGGRGTPRHKRPTIIMSASKAESRYEVVDKLGSGGMAEVFRAVLRGDEGFQRVVAIKRVLPGFDKNPAFYAMFLSEAQLASWLRHPNIVQVLDFSRDENGQPFIAMDYIHGIDLEKLMSSGPLPPSVMIYVLSEICRGLHYAHNAIDPRSGVPIGMIHRDIKPQNALIGYEGNVVLADFGLAKLFSASGRAVSAVVKGTPQYMSPEQCRGLSLDRTTDLWAIGVMLWEMLAGCALFHGLSNEVLSQVQFKDIPLPSAVAAANNAHSPDAVARVVPPDLERIAMKLLVRDAAQREFLDAQMLLDALLACNHAPRDGRGELVRLTAERFADSPARLRSSVPPRSSPDRATLTAGTPLAYLPSSPPFPPGAPDGPRRRRALHVLLALAVAALAAGGTFLLVRGLTRGRAVADTSDASLIAVTPPDAPPFVQRDATVPTDAAELALAQEAASASDAGIAGADSAQPSADANASTRTATRDTRRTSRTAPTGPTGTVVIDMTPSWAYVSARGQSCQSPCRLKLAAGKQKVRLRNPDLRKDQTVTVTVRADATTTVTSPW